MLKSAMANFHVIIPAAGSGSRMAAGIPKQYLPLLGKPVLWHTLQVFVRCPRISSISVVLSPDDSRWQAADFPAGLHLLRCGGETRAATVLNALDSMQPMVAAEDWVLVHDAARPCLQSRQLDRLLHDLEDDVVGGLLAMPLADTLKRVDSQQRVDRTEARDHLWLAQTPQMFRYELLARALRSFQGMPTDEAQAVEALGFQPKLVVGGFNNLKITYAQDMALAEAIVQANMKRGET